MYSFGDKELFSPIPSTPQEKVRTAYNRAFVNWQASWVEMYRDQSFYLNNQWSPEERRYLQQEQRPDYVYNLARACINMVQGYQRKHRSSIVCQPVELSSQETADLFTKVMMHSMRRGNGYYAISEAFKGGLVTGIGYVKIWVDYREDPENGDIKYDFVPWNAVITDPFWTRLDFSDCDYILERAYMDKREAISKFPEKKEMIMKMVGNMRDDLFTFLPQQRIFQSQNLLAYTEYWEQQWKDVTVIVNPFTLQEIVVTAKNRKQLAPLLNVPGIKSFKRQERVIKWTALLNNEVVAEDENPYNLNEYPYIPIIAVYAPEYDLYQYKIQGLLRCIRDPSIEFNKRISKITDFIDSQINSGWIVKKDKFDNYADFYKTGQGRVIFAKTNADVNADARQIAAANIPGGLLELQQIFSQLIMRICGVNEELLGAAQDDQPGILSMLRQGAGLINLQDVFDYLRQSQEIIGNRTIKCIQNNFSPEKVFKITKQQPTAEFYNKSFGKYDAVCVEGQLTDTQQQLFFGQLMTFKQMGGPVPWKTILKAMPMQGKSELMKDIEQEEQQQQQMMQMQMQKEMQDKAVVNELLIQESQAKKATAYEKLAKANEDRALTEYHRAKAIKEMDGVDVDNLNKFIDAILKIENAEKAEEQEFINETPQPK